LFGSPAKLKASGLSPVGKAVTHSHLAPRLKKEYSYTSVSLSGPSLPVLGSSLPLPSAGMVHPVVLVHADTNRQSPNVIYVARDQETS